VGIIMEERCRCFFPYILLFGGFLRSALLAGERIAEQDEECMKEKASFKKIGHIIR
jgi:hypothetical protein